MLYLKPKCSPELIMHLGIASVKILSQFPNFQLPIVTRVHTEGSVPSNLYCWLEDMKENYQIAALAQFL